MSKTKQTKIHKPAKNFSELSSALKKNLQRRKLASKAALNKKEQKKDE